MIWLPLSAAGTDLTHKSALSLTHLPPTGQNPMYLYGGTVIMFITHCDYFMQDRSIEIQLKRWLLRDVIANNVSVIIKFSIKVFEMYYVMRPFQRAA